MSFDDEVDQLKRDLVTARLDPVQRKVATAKLCQKLKDTINSRRLLFVADHEHEEPFVLIKHTGTKEHLASVFVNEDSSITFQAPQAAENGKDSAEDEESGYFPPYVEYFNEVEFLEDAPEVLKMGVAEYELDQEEGGA